MEKKKILLVEDDLKMAGHVRRQLETGKYEVSVDYEGDPGRVKAEAPDLVIMETVSSGIDAFAMMKEIRKLTPPVPVLGLVPDSGRSYGAMQ